jgi:hypothetical protein
MRVFMTLHVRDEAELLEAHLRYHLNRGVDFAIVMDNDSSDETPDILERFARDGVVHVLHEPGGNWDQQAWLTRMARLAAEMGADWVINSDADEFWWPRRGDLRDVLSIVPEHYGAIVCPRVNFIPRPQEDDPFWRRMVVLDPRSLKPGRRGPKLLKPIRPKLAHRARRDAIVLPGGHDLNGPGLEPVPGWQPIVIFHYPIRSFEQYERKVIRDGAALERGSPIGYKTGEERYQLYKQGRLRDDYESRLLDAATVDAGIRDGTLVVDRRLERFMTRNVGAAADVGDDGEHADVLDELRFDLCRAVYEAERDQQVIKAAERSGRRAERRSVQPAVKSRK